MEQNSFGQTTTENKQIIVLLLATGDNQGLGIIHFSQTKENDRF